MRARLEKRRLHFRFSSTRKQTAANGLRECMTKGDSRIGWKHVRKRDRSNTSLGASM